MTCKKHPTDFSSTVGVCASCLRERLFAIMAAQALAQQECRKSDTRQPRPLSFPRSVSPYISRRKSDTNTSHNQLFHSTPLVGPTGSAQLETTKSKKSGRGGRFSSLFSGLFRSRTNNPDPDSGPGVPGESYSVSPSWFSSIILGRREKQIRTSAPDEGATRARGRACRDRDRGMSPARYSDDDDDEHYRGGSSGYSSESSQGWRWTPRRTPAAHKGGVRGAGHSRNAPGLAFCLSPLVRTSPNRRWNQNGVPTDMVVAGESMVPPKAHLWATTSFCKNKSRKLADFGRYSYNTNH